MFKSLVLASLLLASVPSLDQYELVGAVPKVCPSGDVVVLEGYVKKENTSPENLDFVVYRDKEDHALVGVSFKGDEVDRVFFYPTDETLTVDEAKAKYPSGPCDMIGIKGT